MAQISIKAAKVYMACVQYIEAHDKVRKQRYDDWIKKYKTKTIGFLFWKKQIELTEKQVIEEIKKDEDNYITFLVDTQCKRKEENKIEDIKKLCLLNFTGNITITDEEYHILQHYLPVKEKKNEY